MTPSCKERLPRKYSCNLSRPPARRPPSIDVVGRMRRLGALRGLRTRRVRRHLACHVALDVVERVAMARTPHAACQAALGRVAELVRNGVELTNHLDKLVIRGQAFGMALIEAAVVMRIHVKLGSEAEREHGHQRLDHLQVVEALATESLRIRSYPGGRISTTIEDDE